MRRSLNFVGIIADDEFCYSGINHHFRDRHYKLSTPISDVRQLFHNFGLEVPGKNKNVIRLCFTNLTRVVDGYMSTWRVLPVFVGITVHSVVNEVCSDAAVIQQGIPLSRCSVARNRFSFPFGLSEKV